MPPSFREIPYALRPAKNIERKMITGTLMRLSHFADLMSYRYVGFGSNTFIDFVLMHRVLGIDRMVSIEKSTMYMDRFEFNKPFQCIELRFGESTVELPKLDWEQRTIFWLDYDGFISEDVLLDIETVCDGAVSGSVLFVTVNADPRSLDSSKAVEEHEAPRLAALHSAVGATRVPSRIANDTQLGGWRTCNIIRHIIDEAVHEALDNRNAVLSSNQQLGYRQLVHFHYSDGKGPKMLTIGGILVANEDRDRADACGFERDPWFRSEDSEFRIAAPVFTLRELIHLDAQMPCGNLADLDLRGIPLKDAERYVGLYRYFPAFVEAEI